MMPKTLQARLLLIPGALIKSGGNRNILQLPDNFLYRDVFEYALKTIEKLEI